VCVHCRQPHSPPLCHKRKISNACDWCIDRELRPVSHSERLLFPFVLIIKLRYCGLVFARCIAAVIPTLMRVLCLVLCVLLYHVIMLEPLVWFEFHLSLNCCVCQRSTMTQCIITGSIARSARRRYLIYSDADFEVFARRGDTLHRWRGEGNLAQRVPSSMPNFTPSMQRLGYRTPKLKFLLRFDQNVEYKRPADFVPRFRMVWLLKFSWICSRGCGVMGVLSWGCLAIPKFSAPPSGETMRQTPKCFRGARTCSRSSITMRSLVGLGFHPLSLSVCLSVCPSRFWTSEFVRPISPWRRGSRETILMPFRRGKFVVAHPCSTFSECCQLATSKNAEVQQTTKLGVFAARGRQNKPIETKLGT